MLTGERALAYVAGLRRGAALGRGMMGTVYAVEGEPGLVLKVGRVLPAEAAEHARQLAAHAAGRAWRPRRAGAAGGPGAGSAGSSLPERSGLVRECEFAWREARGGGARGAAGAAGAAKDDAGPYLLPVAVAVRHCAHRQRHPFPLELLPPAARRHHAALAASPWCALKVYRRLGGSLDRLAPTLSPAELYSAAAQLAAAVGALHARGWVHGDLHPGNAGWAPTGRASVELAVGGAAGGAAGVPLRVPSFGRRYLLIDVEPMRADYGLGRGERREFEKAATSELKWLLLNLFVEYPFWEMVKRERLRVRSGPAVMAAFLRRHAALDAALRAAGVGALVDRFALFELIDPEAHQRIALGKEFKRTYPPRLRVPMAAVMALFRGEDGASGAPARMAHLFARVAKLEHEKRKKK